MEIKSKSITIDRDYHMRILFLCHRFLDTQIGGLAEFLHYLPLSLKNIGVESIIYTQNEDHSDQLSSPITLRNGVTCYTGPLIKPSFFTSRKKLNPLLTLCESEKIDLIHAQGIYRAGYMAMKIFQKKKIPYIVTSHSDILSTSSDRMKRGKVKTRCAHVLKHANAATHLTPMMANAAHDIYDTQKKSVIIGNGIDLCAWKKHINAVEKNFILAIGRLEREKGFHVLIDAIAEVKKQNKNISLVIAGSGAEEKNLQQQAKQLGLCVVTDYKNHQEIPENSIVFTGYINGETKMQLMSQAKIVLFAPQPKIWEEPFGIVQLEAMAAGKPLIASDTAATRYLQTLGLQTFIVEADDATAWANAINELLTDSTVRMDMGKNNQQSSEKFDWDFVAKQYREAYIKCLG
jgi:glycosyltransferase involved in cell wall biosynthesis